MLNKNELTLISNLIYKIYTIDDLTEMRQSVLDSLKLLIDSDMSTFELASDDSPYHVTDPVGTGTNRKDMQYYLDEIQEYDYGRWTYSASSGGVYRETDFMDDEKRVNTAYYRNFFKPAGVHYSAMLTIIRNQTFYGVIALFRSKEKSDFSDQDLFLLSLLQDHLGYRLEKEKLGTGSAGSFPSEQDLSELYGLTKRESQIALLLLKGDSQRKICDRLSIAPNTLKKHSSNIYRKLDVNSWREMMGLLLNR